MVFSTFSGAICLIGWEKEEGGEEGAYALLHLVYE